MDSLKSSVKISEVVLLAPSLDQEYYRKLLNCLIADFEVANLQEIDLFEGLDQVIQPAGPDNLYPDDLIKVLRTLRTHFQDIHKQSPKHLHHLIVAPLVFWMSWSKARSRI